MKPKDPDRQKEGQRIADILNANPYPTLELAVFHPELYFACWPARGGTIVQPAKEAMG